MVIADVSSWWVSLEIAEKIYWGMALPFSILFLIQVVLTFVGGDVDDMDADGDADATIDGDDGIPFQFLSLKNIIAFFTIFGWTGIVTLDAGMSVYASAAVSLSAGLLMMLIMASVFYMMGKLTESGNLKIQNAIGKTGSVYLVIPAKRKSRGKVQFQLQGFRTMEAITDEDEDIPTGGICEIIEVINNDILLVRSCK